MEMHSAAGLRRVCARADDGRRPRCEPCSPERCTADALWEPYANTPISGVASRPFLSCCWCPCCMPSSCSI